MTPTHEPIGFIGMGIMGRGMAANLLKAGFPVTVWNRTPARCAEVQAQGAHVAATPAELARHSRIVITCVSDTPDVEAVIFGPDGALAGAHPQTLFIDMSTISPQATAEFAARLTMAGMHMLDAPVSGGSEGAAKGTLSIMVGGPQADFERALPALQAMGKTITHVGVQHGDGQSVKLVNQILVVGTMLAISEAFVFAEASGVDLEKTLKAVAGGAAGSWMLTNRMPQVLNRDWRPGFTIDLQQKDLRLVLAAADAVGAPMLTTSTVFHMYRTLQHAGLGAEGNHALIKAVERLAGLTVGQEPNDASESPTD